MHNNNISRARTYLAKIPPAVEGSNGHTQTFKAAMHLVLGFDLTDEQAFVLLKEWNAKCRPLWSDGELRYKIREARSKGGMPVGHHLKSKSYSLVPKHPPRAVAWSFPESKPDKAWLRERWPLLTPLSFDEVKQVAALRGIDATDVMIANVILGSPLYSGVVDGHRSVVIHQDLFAQARRLDGQPFIISGMPKKVKNLSGSDGAFVGMRHPLSQFRVVFLVEGVFGLLDFFAAFRFAGYPHGIAVVAANSSTSRFERQPEWLRRLEGACVRILPDNESSGHRAAQYWHTSLLPVSRSVEIWPLPDFVKDLGDLVQNPSPTNIQTITRLLTP